MGGAASWRLVQTRRRVPGKPGAQGSGLVLGQPLKRSRSPREDPPSQSMILGGLEREDPGAEPVKGERHEGSVEAMATLAFPG